VNGKRIRMLIYSFIFRVSFAVGLCPREGTEREKCRKEVNQCDCGGTIAGIFKPLFSSVDSDSRRNSVQWLASL
jgi:hypothetical protein